MAGGASPRRRGDYFERQTKADLETRGWLVVRAPGSGSGSAGTPLEGTGSDLLAITKGERPLLVSCKLGGVISPAERETLATVAHRYDALAYVAMRLRPGVIAYRRLRANDANAPKRE